MQIVVEFAAKSLSDLIGCNNVDTNFVCNV